MPESIPKRVFSRQLFIFEYLVQYLLQSARRKRKANFDQLIQMDASVHEWVAGVKWNLHIAIDDATGIITSAFFDKQKTMNIQF